MLEEVEKRIQALNLLSDGQRVVVAVSGGLDSMVLLFLLKKLSAKHRWNLEIAHFNHQLRGQHSAADEMFVRNAAERMELRCTWDGTDVRKHARDRSISIEMAARELRHRFLARTAGDLGSDTVALAHHSGDQLELFFLRLFRGAGGDGLAGMDWCRPSSCDPHVRLIRPLLSVSRKELEFYARTESIEYREDATNADLDCLRNRIRHELLPLLRSHYQPGLDKTITRVMELVGADSEFVHQSASSSAGQSGEIPFEDLHVAVQRSLIRSELLKFEIEPEFDLIENLRANTRVWVMVRPDLTMLRETDGTLRARLPEGEVTFNTDETSVNLEPSSGTIEHGGALIQWFIEPGANLSSASSPNEQGTELFDAGRIRTSIVLRHWRPGDRFQPIGMSSPVKLQNLFTNNKIPHAQRHRLIVGATAENEIFWVEGLRISEMFKLTPLTKRTLRWIWKREDSESFN